MSIQRILILITLVVSFACTRNNAEITGLVNDGGDKIITLERLDVNRTSVIDSVKILKDGSFSFKTRLEEPELYILKYEPGDIVNLLIGPGEKVSISTSSESFGSGYQVTGSEESENIRLLVEHLDQTRNMLDSLLTVADSIENPESPQMDLIRSAYAQAIIKQKRYTIRYLVENMGSLSSVYALYQKYDEENLILGNDTDLQYFKTVADSLEMTYPNSSLTKSLRADIDTQEALYKEAEHVNNLLSLANEESGMLDLSIPDREGEEVTLSSLNGEVVLVVFWSSGNEASVKSLLQMQSTYNRYHNSGFEIYAISLDNNKSSWMNAIDFNEFKWINVSELSYPNSMANVLYNVTAIPSTFLIDRKGDIVAKNLYGRTLETWLDNLI
ncbi:MAG: TlpA disulfide reductase family protein [Bacteroidota bacterium]